MSSLAICLSLPILGCIFSPTLGGNKSSIVNPLLMIITAKRHDAASESEEQADYCNLELYRNDLRIYAL